MKGQEAEEKPAVMGERGYTHRGGVIGIDELEEQLPQRDPVGTRSQHTLTVESLKDLCKNDF